MRGGEHENIIWKIFLVMLHGHDDSVCFCPGSPDG
jgi:hypothetical protein